MLFKRGRTYYYEFQYEGRRVRESAKTTNKTAALRAEANARSARFHGTQVDIPGAGEFEELFEQFLSWAAAHVKANTHKRYGVSGKRLRSDFCDQSVADISAGGIERFKADRLKECSSAGLNRDLACLKTFFNWAVRLRYVKENPVKGVKFLKEPSGVMRIVSPEEEELYLKEAKQPLHDVAVLMLNTGMRPMEIFSLQSKQVFEDYVQVEEGKTVFARRAIPLNEKTLEVLKRRKNGSWLFPGRFGGHIHQVRQHEKLCRRLRFDFRLYDFRHTFGSRMTMAGVDLPTLKELMGHSDIRITMRYVHPTPEHKKLAIAKLTPPKVTPKKS